MRTVINTVANVTTTRIANRQVRTVVAGVDALRSASSHHQRLYAAPAPQAWADQPLPGGSELLSRCSRREMSRCRRPRVSSCLARS